MDCHGVSIKLRFLSQFKGDLYVSSTQEIVTKVVCYQVAELKTSMQSILEEWRVYDEAYTEVSLMTTRYLYCIDQCKRSVVSQEALENQVKTLQVNLLKLSYFCTSFCTFKQTNSTEKKNTEKIIWATSSLLSCHWSQWNIFVLPPEALRTIRILTLFSTEVQLWCNLGTKVQERSTGQLLPCLPYCGLAEPPFWIAKIPWHFSLLHMLKGIPTWSTMSPCSLALHSPDGHVHSTTIPHANVYSVHV